MAARRPRHCACLAHSESIRRRIRRRHGIANNGSARNHDQSGSQSLAVTQSQTQSHGEGPDLPRAHSCVHWRKKVERKKKKKKRRMSPRNMYRVVCAKGANRTRELNGPMGHCHLFEALVVPRGHLMQVGAHRPLAGLRGVWELGMPSSFSRASTILQVLWR